MPTIGEELGQIEGAAKRLFHRQHLNAWTDETHVMPAAALPSFTARTSQQSQPSQPEVPVSSFTDQLHRWADVAEKFGENGISVLEAVVSNPDTLSLVLVGARLLDLPLTAGTLTVTVNNLKAIENTWHAAQAAMQPPAQLVPDGSGGTVAAPLQPPADGQQQAAQAEAVAPRGHGGRGTGQPQGTAQ
jgi:hypothetical protein